MAELHLCRFGGANQSSRALGMRARLLAATALGCSLAALGATESHAQQPPACTASQVTGTPPNATIDLKGTSCTLPPAAYPTAASSSGTTITNSVATAASLYQGTAGATEVYAGTIADGAGTVGTVLQAGTLIAQPATAGYQYSNSGPTLIQGGTLILNAPNVASPNTAVTISSGGTMDLGGFAQTVQSVNLQGGTVQNGTLTGPITASGGFLSSITTASPISIAGSLGLLGTNALSGVISGPGSLTQVGPGTSTLSAANTYSGATVVSAGTLAVASTGSIGSTSSLTVNGGTFNNAGTTTTTGALTVAAGATVLNSGTLNIDSMVNNGTVTITGSLYSQNGFTNNGTFNANAGFYQIQNPSNIVNNGTYNADINTNGLIISNNAGGTWNGNLTVNGASATNNVGGIWNGDATINSGSMTNNGTWTSKSAGFFNAGTLTTTGVLNATIGGVTNSGTLNASGTLNGIVTNTGGFNVTAPLAGITTFNQQAGTLNLGNTTLGVTAFNLSGGTVQNGTLNASAGYTLQGGTAAATLAGAGGLTASSGLSTLSAVNSYTGATTISGGTLALIGSGSIAASSGVAVGGTLDISGNTAGAALKTLSGAGVVALGAQNLTVTAGSSAFSGAIGGTGGFILSSGTQTLSGTNSYSGPTAVVGGILEVNGSIVSATTVGNGATLAGAGSVGPVSVQSGGILAPGSLAAQGTMTVNGPLALGAGSIYLVRATPTTADLTTVNGAAALGGGSVALVANGTFAQPTSYKILTASQGVTGTFSSITTNMAFLTPTLSYDANDAIVTLNRNTTTLPQVAATTNTGAVASALNAGGNSTLLNAFTGLSAPQAQAALNSISGEPSASTQTAGQAATRVFTNYVSDRATPEGSGGDGSTVQVSAGSTLPAGATQYAALEKKPEVIVVARAPVTPLYRVFATGFGGANVTASQGAGVAGTNGTFYGGLVGIDYRVRPDLLIGAAAGGNTTSFLVPARGSSGNVTGFNGSLFAVASYGPFYVQSLTTLSSFSNNSTRNIAGFGGLPSAVEKASYGSFEVRTRAEFGRVVKVDDTQYLKNVKITPFVALELAQLATNGFSEFNALGGANIFGLNTQARTYADVKSFLGARVETSFDAGNGVTIRPIVRLAYVHSYSPAPAIVNTFQSVPAASFTVNGSGVAHNSAETKAGAEFDIGHGTVFFANFEGNFSTLEQIYGGRGGVRYSW